jgi:N utilization substance protein A
MSKALIAGINQVATDKGLDREVIFSAIEAALVSAYKRNYGSVANVTAEVDRVSGDMRVFAEREVVEEVFNPRTEITTQDARKVAPTVQLGDVIKVLTQPADFGRIAAQTAKQVILQRIREAERDTVYENFAHHVGEIITGQVRSIDALSGAATIMLEDKHEVLMMRDEQIPTEKLRRGDFAKVYVVDVHKSSRGPVIKISRTHKNLLKRLMEQEIPEVRDGTVEIKSIAREPGARSKVAVIATKPDVDPVGSCVGQRGLRIQNIVNELGGEKIDVVEWNSDPLKYISNALSPAKVNSVLLDEKSSLKTALVLVPDRQLSLAIGKEGQNARLAAKLTGWRIDIKSETEAAAEGLDRLAGERMQRGLRGDDLLAAAERILRQDERGISEDRLSQAARALENMKELPSEAIELPKFSELPSLEPASTVDHSKWDMVMDELGKLGQAPSLPGFSEEESLSFEEPGPIAEEESEEQPSPAKPFEPLLPELPELPAITAAGELPEVITADMLRARRAGRKEKKFTEEVVEIPSELLVGLEEVEVKDDWTPEMDGGDRGKGRGKGKKPTVAAKPDKKKKKKWRPAPTGDEFEDYYQ